MPNPPRVFGGWAPRIVLAAFCLAIVFVVASPPAGAQSTQPLSKSPDGRALSLSFSDEFGANGDDAGPGWSTTFGDGRATDLGQRTIASNNEEQLYVDRAYTARLGLRASDPVSVRDGILTIRAERAAPADLGKLSGLKFTSGLISSLPSISQRYGYFEVRARVPRGKGLWSAIWMLPSDHTWPPEIDIMESIGNPAEVYVTAHSGAVPSNTIKVPVSEDFHTYAVSWDRDNLVWYIDGREVARQATPADMHKPMYLIANLAVGGKWPGSPDSGTNFPAVLALDYVRIYRFADPGGQ